MFKLSNTQSDNYIFKYYIFGVFGKYKRIRSNAQMYNFSYSICVFMYKIHRNKYGA